MKYRKKPVVIDAEQWFKHGDNPEVTEIGGDLTASKPGWECGYCKENRTSHGYIFTMEGGHIVCRNDWIIKGVKGEHYPCKPDIFEQTYERVEE